MLTVIFYLLLAIYFLICLFLVLVVLSQEGKGGGLSGMVGGAALGETFGFSGAETALRKWTRNITIMFFVLTVVLTFMGEQLHKRWSGLFDVPATEAAATAPATAQPGEATAIQPTEATPPAVAPATAPPTNAPVSTPATITVTPDAAAAAEVTPAPAVVTADPAAPAAAAAVTTTTAP